DPDEELLDDGPLETELLADLGHLLGGGAVSRDDGGGIARRQTEEEKDEYCHYRHDRNGGEQAANDITQPGTPRPPPPPRPRRGPDARARAAASLRGRFSGAPRTRWRAPR